MTTGKDIRYGTAAVVSSDGMRFDATERLKAISVAADQAYKSFNGGDIGVKAFDAQMTRLENDRAAVEQERRNAKAVAKWAGSADSGAAGYSRPPGLAVVGRTIVRTKDSLGFNDTAESQLPAQLASPGLYAELLA
jgi:hypothetical protein